MCRDYDTYYNEHNGRSKTYKRFGPKDESVYFPKQKENGKNKRTEIGECENCMYHIMIIYDEHFGKKIACGFRNNLTRK